MQYIINIYGNEKTSIIWHMYMAWKFMQDCHGFSMMRVIKNFHISNNKGQNIIIFPKIDDINGQIIDFLNSLLHDGKALHVTYLTAAPHLVMLCSFLILAGYLQTTSMAIWKIKIVNYLKDVNICTCISYPKAEIFWLLKIYFFKVGFVLKQ